jgi:NTP pyrophosphatase (non-canonical NTP hydrolase)
MKNLKIDEIKDYQNYFKGLYQSQNDERSWEDIIGFLTRTTGYLTRSLIKGNASKQDFVRSISWLFALANKLEIDLQTSFYKKYPGICPYCIENTCCCFRTNKKPVKQIAPYKIIEELGNRYDQVHLLGAQHFDGAIKQLTKIYPNNEVIWHFSGPWMNCSKLFEEVAELHEAISKYKSKVKKRENVEQEFADVLAWILSAWSSSNRGLSLDEDIKDYFYVGCPVCHTSPCICSESDARIQGLVDADKFKELRLLFEELEAISPDAQEYIEELITSLKSVEESQNEAVANATINDAKSSMELLESKLEKTDAISKKLASIGKSVMSLVGFVS